MNETKPGVHGTPLHRFDGIPICYYPPALARLHPGVHMPVKRTEMANTDKAHIIDGGFLSYEIRDNEPLLLMVVALCLA